MPAGMASRGSGAIFQQPGMRRMQEHNCMMSESCSIMLAARPGTESSRTCFFFRPHLFPATVCGSECISRHSRDTMDTRGKIRGPRYAEELAPVGRICFNVLKIWCGFVFSYADGCPQCYKPVKVPVRPGFPTHTLAPRSWKLGGWSLLRSKSLLCRC